VIGAGVAGLACARTLTDHGYGVTVLEKGRGVGGRLSTRREGEWRFDHGAPYMQFADGRTRPYVESWEHDGSLVTLGGHHTGRGAISTWPKHLAADVAVKSGVQVQRVERTGSGWQLTDQHGAVHHSDALVLAVPAPQAVALLNGHSPLVVAALRDVGMTPCWSTMVVFDAPPPVRVVERLLHGELLVANDDRLARCVRQAVAPGRSSAEAWVVQSGAAWSISNLERAGNDVCAEISPLLREQLEIAGTVLYSTSHRWRYARTAVGVPVTHLWDGAAMLGACGDFATAFPNAASDVERAWLSGVAMAGRILGG
jgi:renalase